MTAFATIKNLQIRIASNDDQMAYKELFELFYLPLRQFAILFVKNRENAEEIVSDVFLSIWEKRKRLESISNLKVYLYIATKNTALNYLKTQNRYTTVDMDQLPVELTSLYFDPEQILITSEMQKKIFQAVDALPARCRLIFKLLKEDQLKYREVAEVLNLSVKTIEAQMTIALKRIGEAIRFDIEASLPSR